MKSVANLNFSLGDPRSVRVLLITAILAVSMGNGNAAVTDSAEKSQLVRNLETIFNNASFASIPGKIFPAADHGAKSDGRTVDTTAIQSAIDAANSAGGGVVTLTQGTTLSGALFLKSNVELRLDEGVILQAVEDIFAFPDRRTRIAGIEMDWPAALINITNAENVRLTGPGVIDGSGPHWWRIFNDMRPDYEKRGLRWAVDYDAKRVRPVLVYESKNVLLRDFTIKRSGFWTISLTYSERVHVTGVTILNNIGGHGPSTDGIDVDSSQEILIERCDIDCNDDNFCIKAGRDSDGLRVNRPAKNIVIRHCVAGKGHGLITLGSETSGGMSGIEVYGMKAAGTQFGFRIKSAKVRGGTIRDVFVHDMEMDGVANPFHWELNWYPAYSYPPRPKTIPEAEWPAHWHVLLTPVTPPERGIPSVSDIRISNVRVTNADLGLFANAYPEKPIRNVVFENVSIEAKSGGSLNHCQDWTMRNVTLRSKSQLVLKNSKNVELPKFNP